MEEVIKLLGPVVWRSSAREKGKDGVGDRRVLWTGFYCPFQSRLSRSHTSFLSCSLLFSYNNYFKLSRYIV